MTFSPGLVFPAVPIEDDDVRSRRLSEAAAADAAQGRDVLPPLVGHGRGLRTDHHAGAG